MKKRTITKVDSIYQDNKISKREKVDQRRYGVSPVGNIYYVHPSHVVDKSKMQSYARKKGNTNPRPVAITSKKTGSNVGVSQLYGGPGKGGQVKRGQRIPLSQTQMKKRSWLDTDELDTSKKTGKSFEPGVSPLLKKVSRVHPKDLSKFRKARQQKKSH